MLDNISSVLCVTMLGLGIFYYFYTASKKTKNSATTVPGLTPHDDIQGNFPDIAAAGSFHEFLTTIHHTHGDIASFWWGPQLTVSIASPTLFRQHAKVFDRPDALFQMFTPIFGKKNLSLVNGEEGMKRYGCVRRCYTTENIDTYYTIFKKISDDVIQKWDTSASHDEHIPLKEHMFAFAIKSLLRASYGWFFDSDEQVLAMGVAYDYCFKEMEARLHGDIPETGSQRLAKFDKEKAVLYDQIKRAMTHRHENPPEPGERLLIDAIIEEDLPESLKLQDLITVFIAGFHTTGLCNNVVTVVFISVAIF